MPVYSAIKEYSSFEDAMKGVAKQVDGARTDSGELTSVYYDMAKEIKAISEEIPQLNGAIDIAALVEGAARMGVQGKDNLLNFAKTAAKAATAFELPAGQLAEDMGKIANLYKIPISNIEQLGDAINYLDDNAQSKGADIIDVLQRLGAWPTSSITGRPPLSARRSSAWGLRRRSPPVPPTPWCESWAWQRCRASASRQASRR